MKTLLATTCLSVLAFTAACGDSGSTGGAGGQASTTSAAQQSGTSATASGSQSTGAGSGSTTTATTGSATGSQTSASTGAGGFAQLSLELCETINTYRASQGLAAVPVSVSLMEVAEAHVADLDAHPEVLDGDCNLHSWSDTSNEFSGCCYTPDHAQAACMWDKPRELTDYTGNGYEIAASGTPTPQAALSAWQGSPPHHDVIRNAGQWSNYSPWPAMGCGILGTYAVVWFGDATDPNTL